MDKGTENIDTTVVSNGKKMDVIPDTNPIILQNHRKTQNEIDRSEQLLLIETELKGLLTPAGRQWARSYVLMARVRDQKLYKDQYSSFTQWMNSLADRLHYEVSNLWTRLQAGTQYDSFVKDYAKPHGIAVPTVLEIADKAGAGTIIAASKIREKSPDRGNDAMLKAISGKLTKHQAELEWQHVRGDRHRKHAEKVQHAKSVDHRKSAPKSVSGRTSYSVKDDELRELMDQIGPDDASNVTAKSMCDAFRNSYLWCAPTGFHARTRDVYMTCEEVATDSSTSKHSRRMDICVLTNLDQKFSATSNLTIHCVENKISKSDLVRDHKMQEYVSFCDYFWLSVPPELSKLALAYASPNWGVMTVDESGKIRVVRQALKHDCPNRNITYSQFLSKINFGEWHGNKSTKQISNNI